MQIIEKIDHKIFWPVSLISTAVFCCFATNLKEVLVIIFVYISTLISLFLLMFILFTFMQDPEVRRTGKFNSSRLSLYMLFHILFLFGSIGLGVHFIGNRIILAVLNYVTQIFVLGVGLRKNLK